MLITLELKKMNANFQNLPTLPLRRSLNLPHPVLFRACQTYFKTLRQKFSVGTLFNHFIVAVVVAV